MNSKKINITFFILVLSIIINIFFAKSILVDSKSTTQNRFIYHTTKVALDDFNKSFFDIKSKLEAKGYLDSNDLENSLNMMSTSSVFLSNLKILDESLENNTDFTYLYLEKLSEYLNKGFSLPKKDIEILKSFISLNNELFPSDTIYDDHTINSNYYNNLMLGANITYDDNFDSGELNVSPKLSNYLNSLSKLSSDAMKNLDLRMYDNK